MKTMKTNSEIFEDTKPLCCVCYEDISEEPLPCTHNIHIMCIIKTGKSVCPLCRGDVVIPKENEEEFNNATKDFIMYINDGIVDVEQDLSNSQRPRFCLDSLIMVELLILLSLIVMGTFTTCLIVHFAT